MERDAGIFKATETGYEESTEKKWKGKA